MFPEDPQSERVESALDRIDAMQRHVDRIERTIDRSENLASLGVATGMVAHELNHLLTPIRAYAELALAAPEDPGLVRKALERARDNAVRAGSMVESILSLVGDAAGSPPTGGPDAATDVPATVEDVIEGLPIDPGEVGVRVRTEFAGSVLASVSEPVLSQVLMNLLTNAINAMQPDGGELTIRGRCVGVEDAEAMCSTWNATDTTGVVLEIEDTGRGIATEDLDRIFEPFSRTGPGDCSAAAPGVGLGLAICKRLLDRSGATISVRSEVGNGSCFTLVLPEGRRDEARASSLIS